MKTKYSMWRLNHNKAEVDILLSEKLNLKTMHFTSKIEEYLFRIKPSINQEDIATLNMYVPNKRALEYIKTETDRTQGQIYTQI